MRKQQTSKAVSRKQKTISWAVASQDGLEGEKELLIQINSEGRAFSPEEALDMIVGLCSFYSLTFPEDQAKLIKAVLHFVEQGLLFREEED